MVRKIFILVLFLAFHGSTFLDFMKRTFALPVSQEAALCGRFGNIPRGYDTVMANIAIPLFSITKALR